MKVTFVLEFLSNPDLPWYVFNVRVHVLQNCFTAKDSVALYLS